MDTNFEGASLIGIRFTDSTLENINFQDPQIPLDTTVSNSFSSLSAGVSSVSYTHLRAHET
mgnify:CR=1 FL=1